MEKISTKDRILDAALDLFSEKGYDGASVDQIAELIGIKGPSLYRHYKGKEDILDHLIEALTQHYEQNFGESSKVDKVPASVEELINSSMGRINFTVHDPKIIKIRKLLMIEQFRDSKLAALATKHNHTGLENLYTVIFEKMMEEGTLKKEDPRMLAFEFTAPVTILIQILDREPEKEQEIMAKIKAYMVHFTNKYGM